MLVLEGPDGRPGEGAVDAVDHEMRQREDLVQAHLRRGYERPGAPDVKDDMTGHGRRR